MRAIVRWATRNSPAMNTLMVAALVVGIFSLLSLRREVFPEFDLDMILVSIPYPGAQPDEVEESICQRLERATHPIDGIKKMTAVAQQGGGFLILELETGADARKILNEVRSEVDSIPTLPDKAEKPTVKQITMRTTAIKVGVIGPESSDPKATLKLREVAEKVRNDLLKLPDISQAEISGEKPYQIDVQFSERTLRKYGLTLEQVAGIIRRENIELPGGVIKTNSQEIIVKGKAKALNGEEIKKLPLITQEGGVVLTVGDIADVSDDFGDLASVTRIDGQHGMVIAVSRTSREDLLAVTEAVHDYVKEKQMPAGYRLATWGDRSIDVRDRMVLLGKNGLQGLVLVLLTLALFLEARLAWWVAMGIPIAILGACGVLLLFGQTLNLLSMFAFLMALGIVVDDAIVVGENIYAHRQRGVPPIRAAIDGTMEVLPSVTTSVATTIVAFMPLLYVAGVMGKFIAVMPLAMIAMLVISLLECFTILPCHLSHKSRLIERLHSFSRSVPAWLLLVGGVVVLAGLLAALRFLFNLPGQIGWFVGLAVFVFFVVFLWFLTPLNRLEDLFNWLSTRGNRLLTAIIHNVYLPALRFSLHYPALILTCCIAALLIAFGAVAGGRVPWNIFPKADSKEIRASVHFPDGASEELTKQAVERLEQAIQSVDRKYRTSSKEMPIVKLTRTSVGWSSRGGMPGRSVQTGSFMGDVSVDLVDPSERDLHSQQILKEWRQEWDRLNPAGAFPGIESVSFGTGMMGPGGKAIEFRLLCPPEPEKFRLLEKIVEEAKEKLRTYAGVHDIEDDSQPGKTEYVYSIRDKALAMGINQAELITTLRNSYYGAEVMRLQRGRHEVKLMVRYSENERRKLANLDEIRLRAATGAERPITELADKKVSRSYAEINRVDQQRSITITADVDGKRANARAIVADLQARFMPELKKRYPWLGVRWEGQQKQSQESIQSLMIGFAVALLGMFVLLTIEFRSYFQPLLILAIIPFGAVGAIFGHALLGLQLSMFSLFGLVALSGVVVNDSIVFIDFINHRVRAGMPLWPALLEAGQRRLRPVVLTSITTVAGLLPIMLETSFQAQFLIPMAASLSFGLMATTFLVLFLVPTLYSTYARFFPPKIDEQSADGELATVRLAATIPKVQTGQEPEIAANVAVPANGDQLAEKEESADIITTRP